MRWLALLAGYVAASCAWWHELLPHLGRKTLGGGLLDPGLFIWWLRWTPFAIGHGLNPLHTDYLSALAGVSAMWNTSVFALGTVFAPITLLFGPVVSFNLALILGPPLSAWTAAMWLSRHARMLPAALGGLLFGFSPFVIEHSRAGHLNFSWLIDAARAELADSGAQYFLLGPSHYGYQRQRELATRLLARGPDRTLGGMDLWSLNRSCGAELADGPVCPRR